tara:strand:- start:112 stop:510 length:399 start_codon:yes stop_codon:yes gene_type:complete
MKAILIDPQFTTVTEVEYDGDYKSIYKLLSFNNPFNKLSESPKRHIPRAFDVVAIPVGFDGIYVDDEGLFAPIMYKWEYRYNRMHPPIQLVNKGLVLGCDDEGDSISPDSTVESIRRSITWEWTNEKKVKTA